MRLLHSALRARKIPDDSGALECWRSIVTLPSLEVRERESCPCNPPSPGRQWSPVFILGGQCFIWVAEMYLCWLSRSSLLLFSIWALENEGGSECGEPYLTAPYLLYDAWCLMPDAWCQMHFEWCLWWMHDAFKSQSWVYPTFVLNKGKSQTFTQLETYHWQTNVYKVSH